MTKIFNKNLILGSTELPKESYLDPSKCKPGYERYVNFTYNTKSLFQYDYRFIDNEELFTTVKPTVKECREALTEWFEKHYN